MEHAARHILRDGFERVTLDQIAADARVGKQAIYEYFRNKDDLFRAVVRAEVVRHVITPPPLQGELELALEQYCSDLFDSFCAPRGFGLQRANIVLSRRSPSIAGDLHDQRRDGARSLEGYLREQAGRRVIADLGDEAFEYAVRLGGMTIEGSRYFLGYDLPNSRARRAQCKFAASVFLHGCLEGPRRAGGREVMPTLAIADPAAPQQMRLSRERFESLCGAAADAFLEVGFEGVNIDSLIEASGVSRATIYRQFGNKEGLFRRVIGAEIDAVLTDKITLPPHADFEDALVKIAQAALDRHLRKRSINLHLLLIQEAAAFPDLARRFYDAQIMRLNEPFSAALREAGAPPPSAALVRALHALATYALRYLTGSSRVSRAERAATARQTARILARGVAAPRTR